MTNQFIHSGDALIVVDVQNDFCPGGALAVPEGDLVVPIVNALSPRFDTVVFTRDWHPADHCSFGTPPNYVDGSWPSHCVADSPGAHFHPALSIPEGAYIVSKGVDPAREAYSGFEGTGLDVWLRARGIQRVFICGLATDYCVKATALDAKRLGFDAGVVEDASRGVAPETTARAIDELRAAGVYFVTSGDLR